MTLIMTIHLLEQSIKKPSQMTSYLMVYLMGQLLTATPIHSQQELNHGQALPTKIQLSIHSASQVAVRSPLQGQLVTQ